MCGVYVVEMKCVYVMYVVCMCGVGGYVCERYVMCVSICGRRDVYMCSCMCGVYVCICVVCLLGVCMFVLCSVFCMCLCVCSEQDGS